MPVSFMAWLAVGGLVGWLASALLRTDSREALLLNLSVGALGAELAGWWLAPMVADPVSLEAAAVASLGAAVLLLIVAALSGLSAWLRRVRVP